MTSELESLGSVPLALLGVGLLLAAARGIGGCVVADVQSARTIWEREILRIAVGLTLLGWIGVTLGQLHALRGGTSVVVLAVLALLPLAWRGWTGSLPRTPGSVAPPVARRRWSWFALPPLLILLVTLGPALAYPTGWDELVYHGVLPRRWLADGAPAFYSDLPYSGFPSLAEILFWMIAPVESVIAPRLAVWVAWLLALALLFGQIRKGAGGRFGLLLTCAFAVSPASLLVSANCYVEALLMLNIAALMVAIDLRHCGRRAGGGRGSPLVLGVLAGGAVAVKLAGLAMLGLPLVWYVAEACRSRAWRRGMSQGAATLAVALLIAAPFYVRPWRATGNPFYPYFDDWFSSDPARLEISAFHHAIGNASFGVRTAESLVTSPILLAFNDRLYDGTFGAQHLVLLALGGLAIVVGVRRPRQWRVVAAPAIAAIVLYIFWWYTAQQARFALPAMLALTALSGFGLRQLRGRWREAVAVLALAAACVSLPWRTAGYYAGSWETLAGVWTWTEYVDDGTGYEYLPFLEAIHDRTPADARLMLIFEHRGFYVPRTHMIGTPFFQEEGFSPPEVFATPEPIMDLLHRQGVTHLAMANSPTGPDRAPEWWDRLEPLFRGIEDCVRQGRLEILWQSERYILFAVRPT